MQKRGVIVKTGAQLLMYMKIVMVASMLCHFMGRQVVAVLMESKLTGCSQKKNSLKWPSVRVGKLSPFEEETREFFHGIELGERAG